MRMPTANFSLISKMISQSKSGQRCLNTPLAEPLVNLGSGPRMRGNFFGWMRQNEELRFLGVFQPALNPVPVN